MAVLGAQTLGLSSVVLVIWTPYFLASCQVSAIYLAMKAYVAGMLLCASLYIPA